MLAPTAAIAASNDTVIVTRPTRFEMASFRAVTFLSSSVRARLDSVTASMAFAIWLEFRVSRMVLMIFEFPPSSGSDDNAACSFSVGIFNQDSAAWGWMLMGGRKFSRAARTSP